MKSWKTTLGGSLAAAGAALMGAGALDWLTASEKHAFMLLGFILTILGPIIMGLSATDLSHTKAVESDVKEIKAATDFLRKGAPLIMLTALLSFSTGCHQLEPGGVYEGDKVLYEADLTIATSYDLLHNFVKWEFDNRSTLSGRPEIRRLADKVRSQTPRLIASALSLRDAYRGSPSTETRNALTRILSTLRQMTVEATPYLATQAELSP